MSNDTHPAASQVRRAYRQAESPLVDPNLANLIMEMLSASDLARVEIVSKGFQELVETVTKNQSISFIGRVVERKPGESWATFLHFLMEMRRSPVSVAVGFRSLLVAPSTGDLWSWGNGASGQLGHGDTQDLLVPRRVEALAAERVVRVTAGSDHCVAVTSTGELWSWGSGMSGQLGHGDTEDHLVPRRVEALAAEHVVHVAAAGNHTLAVTSTGALWSWGYGAEGQLGHGDTQNQLLPKRVETLKAAQVTATITAFYGQFPPSKVLKMTGALLKEVGYELTKQGCMFTDQEIKERNPGFNPSHKKVANATRAEVQVKELCGLVLVHLGCEEDADLDDFEEELRDMYASIKAIIENEGAPHPELELELEQLEEPEEPLAVQSSMSITHVAAGGDHNLVVTSDGEIWVWGRGIGRLPRQVDQDHMRLGSGSGSGSCSGSGS